MRELAFLGPEGTFSHRAAMDLAREGERLVALDRADQVIASALSGERDGVIAFENSLEGPITGNLDLLLETDSQLLITGERVLPISFNVWRRKDDQAPLAGVYSHPFGLAQCSELIGQLGLLTAEANSNGAACRLVAESAEPGWGALAGPDAGERFGLVAVKVEVQNSSRALTRFVRLGLRCPPPTGADRTAFLLVPQQNAPGSLVDLLREFSDRGINMTALKSRPTKELLGHYNFFVECVGHLQDEQMQAAAKGLLGHGVTLRYLGSYPEDRSRSAHRGDSDPAIPAADSGFSEPDALLSEMLALSDPAADEVVGVGDVVVCSAELVVDSSVAKPLRVGVCGLGLIGGSALLALRDAGFSVRGCDIHVPPRSWCAERGIECDGSPEATAREVDLLLLCTPPHSTAAVAAAALAANPSVVVVDSASVKGPVVAEVAKRAQGSSRFLPAHPLTGSERSGFAGASSELIFGAPWAVCPPADDPEGESSTLDVLLGAAPFFDALDATLFVCTADVHDGIVAATSHAPHLVAGALAAAAQAQAGALAGPLSGGSLRDGTRVARAPESMWLEILHANAELTADALDHVAARLDGARDALRAGGRDAISAVWQQGQTASDQIWGGRWNPTEWVEFESEPTWAALLAMCADGVGVRRLRLAEGGRLCGQRTSG